MQRTASTLVTALALAAITSAARAQVAYHMTFETHYDAGAPADAVGGIEGQPDTGFGRFANNGGSTFSGHFLLSGLAADGQVLALDFLGTLTPAGTLSLVAGPESSNAGGWNLVPGQPNLGILMQFQGTVTDGVNTDTIMLSAYDSEIHSGMPRTNPFGETLDNYVLQGGDSMGRDTGDAYEESQAPGHIDFIVTPAPATGLLGVLGAIVTLRRRTRTS